MEIDHKSQDNGGENLEIAEDENVSINQEDPYASLDLFSQKNRIKKPQEETNGVENRDRYKASKIITETSRNQYFKEICTSYFRLAEVPGVARGTS